MGLNISHDAWDGPYSSFGLWRDRVAYAAGIPLPFMDGFYDVDEGLRYIATWTPIEFTYRNILMEYDKFLPLSWDILKPDPIHILLHHSDCDGEIAAEHLNAIADRLEELLPIMNKANAEFERYRRSDWTEKTQQFIAGCRLAASLNEPLEFG